MFASIPYFSYYVCKFRSLKHIYLLHLSIYASILCPSPMPSPLACIANLDPYAHLTCWSIFDKHPRLKQSAVPCRPMCSEAPQRVSLHKQCACRWKMCRPDRSTTRLHKRHEGLPRARPSFTEGSFPISARGPRRALRGACSPEDQKAAEVHRAQKACAAEEPKASRTVRKVPSPHPLLQCFIRGALKRRQLVEVLRPLY